MGKVSDGVIDMTFAEKLNELRAQKSMSQLELSIKAKIPRQIVCRYCSNENPKAPLFYDVIKMCETLDVDIDEFAGTTFKRPEKKEVLTFGDKLKQLLDTKVMTQKELSIATGISEAGISRYITNKRKSPRLDELMKICSALDISLTEFGDCVVREEEK